MSRISARRQNTRKTLIPAEPSLREDCVLVQVNHLTLGRVQRFEEVYNWVGLSLFKLTCIVNGMFTVYYYFYQNLFIATVYNIV